MCFAFCIQSESLEHEHEAWAEWSDTTLDAYANVMLLRSIPPPPSESPPLMPPRPASLGLSPGLGPGPGADYALASSRTLRLHLVNPGEPRTAALSQL